MNYYLESLGMVPETQLVCNQCWLSWLLSTIWLIPDNPQENSNEVLCLFTHMSGWPWRGGWTSPEAVPSALTPGRWRREWWFLQGRRTAGRRCTGCQLCRGSWPTGTAYRTNQSSALKANVLWHLTSLLFCFCFFFGLSARYVGS